MNEEAERMEGEMERDVKRPKREDKPRLPCLDISLCLPWEQIPQYKCSRLMMEWGKRRMRRKGRLS